MGREQQVRALAKFEKALAQAPTIHDQARLCVKIAYTLYCSVRPDHAVPWYERACEKYVYLKDISKAAEIIVGYLSRLRLLESNTPEALACVEKARAMMLPYNTNGTYDAIHQQLEMQRVVFLSRLGRYAEALHAPCNAELVLADSLSPFNYLRTQATLYAVRGQARSTFATFEEAFEQLKGHSAPPVVIAADYAQWAITFGHLNVAIQQYERALFIAQERGAKWRKPFCGLQLVGTLIRAGDYARAKNLFADVIRQNTETPILRVLRSIAAFQVGLATRDAELLKRAPDEKALELAFQSNEPQLIGPLVAGYVQLAESFGNVPLCKQLIARGVQAVTQADHAWDLLALTARYGNRADALRGKSLLLERMELPNHRVAAAYLSAWETYAALRKHNLVLAHSNGEKAARLFARLGWKCQQAEMLALLGKRSPKAEVQTSAVSLRDLQPELTLREQQVADLVRGGLTNRSIAQSLAISESTVESHMTSILSRLGLRSRWQLMQVEHP